MINFQSIRECYHFRDCIVKHHSEYSKEHNIDMDTLAKRLIEARETAGLSQAKLAKLAGVKQSVIGMLETGARKKSSYIPVFAKLLKVSALWLAEGRGDKYDISNLPAGSKIYILTDEEKDIQEIFDSILEMKKGSVKNLKSLGFNANVDQSEPKNGTEHSNGTE